MAALLLGGVSVNALAGTKVVLLGTSGGPTWWPDSERMGTASALVVRENAGNGTEHIYLIDLGPGASQRLGTAFNSGTYTNIDGNNVLKGYPSFLKNVKALFFTHLHMDHTTDFPNLLLCGQSAGMASYPDSEAHKRLQVIGPGARGQLEDVYPAGRTNAAPIINPANPTPGTADMTSYLLQAYAQTINNMTQDAGWSDFSKLLSVHEIPLPPLPRSDYPVDPATGRSLNTAPWPDMAPILVYQDALVTVRATLVNHGPVYGSFAFRFDTADGAVVFSGDTGYPCSNLVQLAQGADVLVHEVIDPAFINNLFPPPLTPATEALKYHLESSHTSIFDVGKHATAAGARTLVLNHIVPGNTPEARLQMAQQNFAGRLIAGRDLMQIEVGAPTGRLNSAVSDFDGDCMSDLALFDPGAGSWYVRSVAGAIRVWDVTWGWPGADPVAGDYDGDGVTDLAVFDSKTGQWFIADTLGQAILWGGAWGFPGAVPVGGFR